MTLKPWQAVCGEREKLTESNLHLCAGMTLREFKAVSQVTLVNGRSKAMVFWFGLGFFEALSLIEWYPG